MTFVADESVHGTIIDRLRADGWSVLAIRSGRLANQRANAWEV